MENLTSSAKLRNAIESMEKEQLDRQKHLVQQIHETYTSINPLNFIKNTLKEAVASPKTFENILMGGVSLAAGVLTRKIIVGHSNNFFRKLIGSGVQFGASAAISQNSDMIKNAGLFLFSILSSHKSHKKKKNKQQTTGK